MSSSPQPRQTPPRVVIIGAGYAGALVARSLEADAKANKLSITIIERRESVHLKIGAIRASVRAGEWTDRVRIPLSRVIRQARTVIGDVALVDQDKKLVMFKDPAQPPVSFDILVCATGTINHSPGDLPPAITNKDEVRAYFRTTSAAIRDAQDVVIVGGGASAVEYAGEIRDTYPDKPITIVCSASHLLSSSVAPMSPKFLKQLYETIEKRNIKLIRDEKVVKPTDVDFGSKKFEKGPLTITTAGEKNLTITTDLLVWCATWNVNVAIYPEEWLNELGELSIQSTFQLMTRDDVFAVGDVCSLAETKQAITLPPKMKVIRHNIVKVAEAMSNGKYGQGFVKGLKSYKTTDKVTMYLPVGLHHGVSQVGSYVYGDKKTEKFKGKDLYTDLFWKTLTGSNAPMLVDSKDDE